MYHRHRPNLLNLTQDISTMRMMTTSTATITEKDITDIGIITVNQEKRIL